MRVVSGIQESLVEGGIRSYLPDEAVHIESCGLCRNHELVQLNVLQERIGLGADSDA
jgi:hypothetical protein